MKRYWLTTALLAAGVCAGCQPSDLARGLVAPNCNPGRIDLAFAGTDKQMIQRKRIDVHRRIRTPDKVMIDVWVIKARPTEGAAAKAHGTVVLLHGLMQSKACFPCLGAGERLAKKGFDVVLLDLRRHGRSGGKFVTYGAKEKYDIKAVIDTLTA